MLAPAVTFITPQKAILKRALHPELNGKTFPKIGFALYVDLVKISLKKKNNKPYILRYSGEALRLPSVIYDRVNSHRSMLGFPTLTRI